MNEHNTKEYVIPLNLRGKSLEELAGVYTPDGSPEGKVTHGQCTTCDRLFPIHKLITETESEGWEYPTYEIHLCPKCDNGGSIEYYEINPPVRKKLRVFRHRLVMLWDKWREERAPAWLWELKERFSKIKACKRFR